MTLVPLVVTTIHKGVFFGYGIVSDATTIRLERARMCIYWPPDNHGVLGLASDGPADGARVGPEVPAITLQGVTALMEVTKKAEQRWQKQLWND